MADAATTTTTAPPATGDKPDKVSAEVRRALELRAQGLPEEVIEADAEQAREWNEYVAVEPILHGTGLAYDVGHAVPKSNVEQYKYDELGWVAKRSTKAAKKAIAQSLGLPEDEVK